MQRKNHSTVYKFSPERYKKVVTAFLIYFIVLLLVSLGLFIATFFYGDTMLLMIPLVSAIYAIVVAILTSNALYTIKDCMKGAENDTYTESKIRDYSHSSDFVYYLCFVPSGEEGSVIDDEEWGDDEAADIFYTKKSARRKTRIKGVPLSIKKKIAELEAINRRIPEKYMSDQIEAISRILTGIYRSVAAEPEKEESVKKLVSYYLPTTVKLLNAYAALSELGVSSPEIDEAKDKIKNSLNEIVQGFTNLLININLYSAVELIAETDALINSLTINGLLPKDDFRVKKY